MLTHAPSVMLTHAPTENAEIIRKLLDKIYPFKLSPMSMRQSNNAV